MHTFYIDVPLQEKILESNSSVCPGKDIMSIKRETRGAEPTRQALVMLQKWAARETATYGQLREKLCTLRTLSVFHI